MLRRTGEKLGNKHNGGTSRVPKRAIRNHERCVRPITIRRWRSRGDAERRRPRAVRSGQIDEHGCSIHLGDFASQTQRVFSNLTALLASERGLGDVVRTTCYLVDFRLPGIQRH
jgi:hypothetical protein